MSQELTIGYLTGSVRAIDNHILGDTVVRSQPRTIKQMFFQPYESKEEFIFCARHTLVPMAIIGASAGLATPLILLTIPLVVAAMDLLFLTIGGIALLCGADNAAGFCFDWVKSMTLNLCQTLIDLVVSPLSLLVMFTRGTSTALHAAGICGTNDNDAELSPDSPAEQEVRMAI